MGCCFWRSGWKSSEESFHSLSHTFGKLDRPMRRATESYIGVKNLQVFPRLSRGGHWSFESACRGLSGRQRQDWAQLLSN